MRKPYKDYFLRDWIVLIVGVLVFISQFLRYNFNLLGDKTIEYPVLGLWVCLVAFPKTLNEIINKIINRK